MKHKVKFIISLAIGFSSVNLGYSQNNAIANSANSMVDLLSGSFQYSIPVLTIPGPNGENVPVVFSYNGGIRTDEQASWIGLGWNYNPGEIKRNVKGSPDDWKGKSIVTKKYSNSTTLVSNINNPVYGPLYFKDYVSPDPIDASKQPMMDIGSSQYMSLDGKLFHYPDYDSYYVTGNGISGTMEPRLFDNGTLRTYQANPVTPLITNFSKNARFVMMADVNAKIENNSWFIANSATLSGYPLLTGGATYSGAILNPTTTNPVAKTSYFIEHFTNYEINTNYSSLKSNGFLDYRVVSSGDRRPTSDFDPNGIGAYKITTPDGLVYHYSLPVYVYNQKSYSFYLNSSFDINSSDELTMVEKADKYAVSWKLTAITGQDFVDLNENGIADIGDSGYWVTYNYGLWTNQFDWRYPFYNFKEDPYFKAADNRYFAADNIYSYYKTDGSISTGVSQEYYLNSIQTGTHTAYFIKSVRLDNHSINNSGITPSLKLDRIVLVKNEDLYLFENSGSLSYDAGFSMTKCNPSNIKPHAGNYSSNSAMIDQNSIQSVELVSEYALAKRNYNNIKTTCSVTQSNYDSNGLILSINKVNEQTGVTLDANGGKLTLAELKLFGLKAKAAAPSYLFDYDKNNSSKNPDFSNYKSDNWGFYKSDYSFTNRTKYTSGASKVNTDAWSLKKITTPLNGEILIEYEPNYYTKVHNGYTYTSPFRYFLINTVSNITSSSVTLYSAYDIDGIWDNSKAGFAYLPYTYPTDFKDEATTTSVTHTTGTNYFVGSNFSPTVNSNASYSISNSGWAFVSQVLDSVSGDGCRVKSITIKDTESNLNYKNEYFYSNGASGAEPQGMFVQDDYKVSVNHRTSDLLQPPAKVSYGRVVIKSKSLNNVYNGRTVFDFNNMYEPNKIGVSSGSISCSQGNPCTLGTPFSTQNPIIQTTVLVNTINGVLGSVSKSAVYDNENNLLSSVQYEYSSTSPSHMETFHEYFYSPYYFFNNLFSRSHSSARLLRKTTYKDGVKIVEEPISFDDITGAVTKFRIIDETNGVTETTTSYAYSVYSAMGPKSLSSTNRNILSPTYKTLITRNKLVKNIYGGYDVAGSPETVAGDKTTWMQNYPLRVFDNTSGRYITQTTSSNLWKPYKSFVFNGESNDANWRESSELTIFNKRNIPIEVKSGVANRYSATKYGYDSKFALCQATDCKYSDFTFSSFEDQESTSWGIYFGGEVSNGNTRFKGDATIVPHTGYYVSKVNGGGSYGPVYNTKGFTTGRSYRASVWVHKSSPSNSSLVFNIDGTSAGVPYSIYKSIDKSDASNVTVGDWILMTLTIDVPSDFTETGGSFGFNDMRAYVYNNGSTPAYFDDFMFRPIDAELSGSVTDEKTGQPLAVVDKFGFATKYIYDDRGRVREIWEETGSYGWKLKTRHTYNFKRSY